jgi:AbrB family looped-hinge helix DNA binding protein
MSKVTSKLQVTVPKAIADEYGIRPGDELDWVPAGDGIRVVPAGKAPAALNLEARLRLFDRATERARRRRRSQPRMETQDRGWTREDLYHRGRSG